MRTSIRLAMPLMIVVLMTDVAGAYQRSNRSKKVRKFGNGATADRSWSGCESEKFRGGTPLMSAAIDRNVDVVKYLIEKRR
jgi:hypothetical protein